MPQIQNHIPLIDEILGSHASELGVDLAGYRNHVYRMVNFCLAQAELGDDARHKITIAGCFHDIGIWTGPSFDYLPPSIIAAERYLSETRAASWIPEIREMIDQHHKLRSCKNNGLVEVFRKGDLVDFSLGLFRCGLPGEFVAEVKRGFPNQGFHRMLVRRAAGWIVRHPLRPIPVIKW